jgi:hypothetical protein
MAEQRKRRTKEDRIAELEAKIEAHKKNILTLEARKKSILSPKPRKAPLSMNSVLKKAKEKGFTAKEIAKKLELNIDD